MEYMPILVMLLGVLRNIQGMYDDGIHREQFVEFLEEPAIEAGLFDYILDAVGVPVENTEVDKDDPIHFCRDEYMDIIMEFINSDVPINSNSVRRLLGTLGEP